MNPHLETTRRKLLHQQEEIRLKLKLAEHQAVTPNEYWDLEMPRRKINEKLIINHENYNRTRSTA